MAMLHVHWQVDWESSLKGKAASRLLEGEDLQKRGLRTHIWYDFFSGIDLDYAQQLVETESIEVTTAMRRWQERRIEELLINGHQAREITLVGNPNRSVFLVALPEGVLVIQCMFDARVDKLAVRLQPEHRHDAAELVVAFSVDQRGLVAARKHMGKTPRPEIRSWPPVPTNLEECFAELKRTLSPESLEDIKKQPKEKLIQYHRGLGMWIRNEWGLWAGSPLTKHFNKMGVFHPDEMSGIIIESFWRHLNGIDIDIEEQLKSLLEREKK